MSSSETKAAVIERFVEHCQRSTQMLLGFIEVDEDVLECASEPEEIVNVLTAEFSIEELTESGIAVVEEDGAVALSPVLIGGAYFVVMRDAVTGRSYDLLTQAGCLTPDTLAVFQILCDGRTQRLVEQGTGVLMVAFDLEHVVMLRACGLPATLGVGLEDLPLEYLEQLSESFDLSCSKRNRVKSCDEITEENNNQSEYHPADPIRRMMKDDVGRAGKTAASPAVKSLSVSAEPITVQLVFLGWMPVELSIAVPLQLKAVVDHFRQLQRFMGVDLYDIGLWEVDNETLERLRFIASRRSTAIFKEALLDVAEEIGAGIVDFGKEKYLAIVPPNDYTTALARLHELSSAKGGTGLPGPDRRNEAWSDVQRLLNRQVVGPLRELALATANPIERNLLMGFAELSNVFHMQSVTMGEQLNRRIADGEGQLPEEQFKNLIAMADRLIGMAKATDKCSQQKTAKIDSRTIDSPSFPRLPHSG